MDSLPCVHVPSGGARESLGREWVREHKGTVRKQKADERLGGRSLWQNPSAVVDLTSWTFIKEVLSGQLPQCTSYHSCHFGHW